MPDVIKLLPDSIANQIAAGEVIQRPASVVKELMENALDAGADHIRLIIKDAGKTLIQVIDNGSGMSDTDARLSFERHATSKIRKAADLFQIRTMGFRGEALASIAAIAHVELKTCLKDSEVGTRIVISGSEVTNQEVCQHNQGTSISVKNLFYNVPARRKFLKSDTVELRHLLEEFHRIAIPNHEIRFQVQHNDKIFFNLPVATRLQRIINIFGKSWQENLIPVDEETADIFLSGFTGNPQDAKKTKTQQYLFINGRYFRSPYLNHAIKGAYENLIPDETRPAFFLFLETDPSMIDVNVHPTKQEIKFENDSLMYNLIKVSVRHALGKFAMMPSLDFDNEGQVFSGGVNPQPREERPGTVSSVDREKQKSQIDSWKNLMKDVDQFASSKINEIPRSTPTLLPEEDLQKTKSPLIQFRESYIIKSSGDQLVIFDQHRVHERILFENFLNSVNDEQMNSQKLVFPITHQLNPGDMEIFQTLIPYLNKMGFELEHFGGETIIIHGIPAGIPDIDPALVIEEVFDSYKGDRLDTGSVTKKLATILARKSAINKGAKLNNEEMQDLLVKLLNCKESHISPIGKMTFMSIPIEEIERKLEK